MTAEMGGRAAISSVSSRVFRVLALTAALGLGGCADLDNMLFGGSEAGPEDQVASAETTPDQTAAQPATPQPVRVPVEVQSTAPVYQPTYSPPSYSPPPMAVEAAAPAQVATITPVIIEQGRNTGTAVGRTAAALRDQVAALQRTLQSNVQVYSTLRNAVGDATARYHQSKARITSRLQIGTTRGNPELVSEWNNAQSALDQLSAHINELNALGASIASNSAAVHNALDQITVTFNVSGAVDEDHTQLSVLQDETNQILVLIDRQLTDVTADIQRQTAYVANERANLTTLASAIKNGELYGSDIGSPMLAAPAGGMRTSGYAYGGAPLVVIRFDHPNVDYQQILYAALSQALQTRPGAAFSVLAVSPTRGTVTAVQLAQTAARRHAEDVMRSMTEMGISASRLSIASSTDPSVAVSEVRVFLR